jgi:hypothetical protein
MCFDPEDFGHEKFRETNLGVVWNAIVTCVVEIPFIASMFYYGVTGLPECWPSQEDIVFDFATYLVIRACISLGLMVLNVVSAILHDYSGHYHCGLLLYGVIGVMRALDFVWFTLGTIFLFNAPVYLCKTEAIHTFQKASWVMDIIKVGFTIVLGLKDQWTVVSQPPKRDKRTAPI